MGCAFKTRQMRLPGFVFKRGYLPRYVQAPGAACDLANSHLWSVMPAKAGMTQKVMARRICQRRPVMDSQPCLTAILAFPQVLAPSGLRLVQSLWASASTSFQERLA